MPSDKPHKPHHQDKHFREHEKQRAERGGKDRQFGREFREDQRRHGQYEHKRLPRDDERGYRHRDKDVRSVPHQSSSLPSYVAKRPPQPSKPPSYAPSTDNARPRPSASIASASPVQRPGGVPHIGSSSVMQELLAEAKKRAAYASGGESPELKRKLSPSEYAPPSKRPAKDVGPPERLTTSVADGPQGPSSSAPGPKRRTMNSSSEGSDAGTGSPASGDDYSKSFSFPVQRKPSDTFTDGGDDEEEEPLYPQRSGLSRWAVAAEPEEQQQEEEEEEGEEVHTAEGAPHSRAASPSGSLRSGQQSPSSSAEGVSADANGSGPLPEQVLDDREGEVNMLRECRTVEDTYERLGRIGEGTYGSVFKARDKATGRICALKKVKIMREHARAGFPQTSIREFNILLALSHPNIVNVSEVVVGANNWDSVLMVMEYMEHDLKALLERRSSNPFSVAEIKCLVAQLLAGVAYLHENWVIHRDLKTSNLLYNNTGELKICDFGLARQYGSPLQPFTTPVVTLWYRSPELLLGETTYSTAVDMWSVGCIMGELLLWKPLFDGRSEIDQVNRIFDVCGTPVVSDSRRESMSFEGNVWEDAKKLEGWHKLKFAHKPNILRSRFPLVGGGVTLTENGFDLLARLLALNPAKRISAKEALNHVWFQEAPRPQKKELMTTFPAGQYNAHVSPARPGKVMG